MTVTANRAVRKRAAPPSSAAPETQVPTLAEIQAGFQAAVMAGDDSILSYIPANSRTTRDVLLGVYRHAYVGRLVDVMANDCEHLAQWFGDDAFRQMARAYVAAHPSRHSNVRWFSRRLPEFLAAHPVYGKHAELAELARLERALGDAFDAPDAPVLSSADLARHPPERWGELTFKPHPSAARLDFSSNAFEIWCALKDEAQPPSAKARREPERLLVWRQDVTPRVRALGAEESMMWDETARGLTFAALCEMVATFDDPDNAALRAATYLNGWIVSGLLTAAKLAPPRRKKPPRRNLE